MVNLLKRRQEDAENIKKEIEVLNSVSHIFSKNKPSILMIHSKDSRINDTNNLFIQAVDKLESYHIEQEKIDIEETRLRNLQKDINAARIRLSTRKAANNKLKNNVFEIFNTNTTENFLLNPYMQITFK